jgi:hypothetical protein
MWYKGLIEFGAKFKTFIVFNKFIMGKYVKFTKYHRHTYNNIEIFKMPLQLLCWFRLNVNCKLTLKHLSYC